MADGEKRVIDLQALTTNDLTANHYFLVDDASNSGETKRYSASDYKVNMQITVAALYNELDLSDVSWDSNIQYHNHDIVIYTDYMLYMCKVDDSTRGTWVSNEWQRITLLELWDDSMMTISTEPMLFDGTPYSKNDIVYRISPNATEPYKMYFYRAKADLPNGISSYVATDWNEFSTITDLIEDCNRQIDKLEDDMSQALALGTASGSIATFTDGSTLPMKKLEVDIEPVQSGSGEPSPTNVRPISGWDECKVSVVGANQWDEEWEVGNINDGSGEDLPQDNVIRTKGYIRVMSGNSYYIKCPTTGISRLFLYAKDKSFITYVPMDNIINNIYTVPNNCEYIRFRTLAAYGTTYNNDVSINYPSTDTSYHAYNGHTYTIDLDGTRYGGKLDVVSGVLTVERGYVDLGSLSWSYTSAQKVFYDSLPTDALNVTNKNGVCEGYKPTIQQTMDSGTWARLSDGEFVFAQNLKTNGRCAVVIKNLNYTDTTEFKSSVNGMKMVYPLSTPQTIQLTPNEVKSLLATNNVFADTGDILDATYVRNANITINELIRRIENLENA